MRSLRFIGVALLIACLPAPTIAGEGGCIAYGDVWAFTASPPQGWVLSCDQKEHSDIPVALWPKGSNWQDAKVVMYVNISDKEAPPETLKQFVDFSDSQFKQDKPGVVIKPAKPLKTGDGRTAIVQDFSGDPWGNFESVAYIDSKTVFAMVVLSARNEKDFRANRAAFEKLVSSYMYMDKTEK